MAAFGTTNKSKALTALGIIACVIVGVIAAMSLLKFTPDLKGGTGDLRATLGLKRLKKTVAGS